MGYGNGATTAAYIGNEGPRVANAPSTREGAIASQMAQLEKGTEFLHMTIAELEARISAVLMAEPPSGTDKASAPHLGAPLGASLSDMNQRIAYAVSRMRGLIDRVDL